MSVIPLVCLESKCWLEPGSVKESYLYGEMRASDLLLWKRSYFLAMARYDSPVRAPLTLLEFMATTQTSSIGKPKLRISNNATTTTIEKFKCQVYQ